MEIRTAAGALTGSTWGLRVHIHILGICGTFMGGVAALAKAGGHTVTGSDANVYPPMSTQLGALGIDLREGYRPENLGEPDIVVVGNAISRGNPELEAVLDQGIPYTSGPQWLAEHLLSDRWVIAVAGTHGKTTTASMVAWILEHAGLEPGFLIGGIPLNFGVSARLGKAPFFVVEADEYDTAFFDKRSKFVHYRPRTAILNNLEFDHADIFPDLAAIELQFHHLVRTVPGNGCLVVNGADPNLGRVMDAGCWTPVEYFALEGGDGWTAQLLCPDGSEFRVLWSGKVVAEVHWNMLGLHNVANGLAAIAAARHAGVPPVIAASALGEFRNVKRRLEVRGEVAGVTVYDDFAHHPTAIAATVHGLRKRVGAKRIVAVLEPRSQTMRRGVHKDALAPALADADSCFVFAPPELTWNVAASLKLGRADIQIFDDIDALIAKLSSQVLAGDHVLIMSNGSFGGIHERLLRELSAREQTGKV